MTIINMDCIEGMRLFPDAHFDSIVTDPPYELGFMGKSWDASGIANNVEMWREALRVLKPGGHLLAFSGSRTYHRMVCAIEDAGFEIRDQIMWVYGSGFPKSLDVSKAIDKAAGAQREVIGQGPNAARRPNPIATGSTFSDDACVWGQGDPITAPATDAARQWQGWGTALKPAHEPIVVARKPLIGTVAANVLRHRTGAINVDGCRVGDEQVEKGRAGRGECESNSLGKKLMGTDAQQWQVGRWPANLIHDGSDEVLAAFPQAPGQQGLAKTDGSANCNAVYGALRNVTKQPEPRSDTGSAARFFYCAKASKTDRGADNVHPTVKPTELMRYLCRLVTPPGGIVLDPFTGSGSTGKAARLEGFGFIGFELDPEYVNIALARIQNAA